MHKNFRYLLYIAFGVILGYLVSKVDFAQFSQQIMPRACTYYGKTYKQGESVKVDCNTCTCNNGNLECTLIACSGS